MKNKRGLSSVITTILIVAIAIVLIGLLAVIINEFVLNESSKIRTDKLTTALSLESATIDLSGENVTVEVRRDAGEGNVTGVKIIVEDNKNAIVFEENTGPFLEFEKRTFELDLAGTIIIPSNIERISVVPILFSGTSGISFGQEDFLEKEELTEIGFSQSGGDEENETSSDQCTLESDCGIDYFMEGTEYCYYDNSAVMQYKKDFSCLSGICSVETYSEEIEICLDGWFCQSATCIQESQECTVKEECGTDGWVGIDRCSSVGEAIVQDYTSYSCTDGFCQSSTQEQLKEECTGEDICVDAECFTPLECTTNDDCPLGEICFEGECVTEEPINTGTVNTVWPFNLAEYFDSATLERSGVDYTGSKIIFPGSAETRCLTVIDHVLPENPLWYAYVRLNDDATQVRAGDSYEIWETNYACYVLNQTQ